MIKVVRMNAKLPLGAIAVNTTSRGQDWEKQLSPFYLGPCDLYGGLVAKRMENAWQFSKVYPQHVDEDGDQTSAYWDWAMGGWLDDRAHRYPMGKGAVPLYSLWNDEKLTYVEARKKVYCPLYAAAVEKTTAYGVLQRMYESETARGGDLYLLDFDGYDRGSKTYEQVLNDPNKKMGHAFVLAMMLDGQRVWEND